MSDGGVPLFDARLVEVEQFGLPRVQPGRYTLSLIITDTLADKAQPINRNMDFIVVN